MRGDFAHLATYAVPGAFALGGLVLGLAVRRLALPVLARIAARSAWKYDDAMVEAVRNPVVVWCVLLGLRLAVRLLPFAAGTDHVIGQIVLVLGILSVAWAAARFTALALNTSVSGGLPGVSLIANVARALVMGVGVLVVLQTLGISITPIITALGVGGLAVGLALQDTLANFFAGIRILASRKVRPGDFIQLDSGQEGFVVDITWAQTTIRQLPNSLVIIPNAKLAGAITTNYALPDLEQAVVMQVGVAYDSDLAQVERVTVEVAREVQAHAEGAVRTFEPFVRFHTFGDSAVEFSVILRAIQHTQRFTVVHDFVKRLHERYGREGIVIPFPMRTVVLQHPDAPARGS